MSGARPDPAQKYAETFNHNVKMVARNLSRHFSTDANVARLLKRINLVVSMDPLMLIKLIGPKLYVYRDKIYDKSTAAEEFALNYGFEDEISKANSEDAEEAGYFIPLVQKYLLSASAAEKKAYHGIVVKMLDDYIEFLSLQL